MLCKSSGSTPQGARTARESRRAMAASVELDERDGGGQDRPWARRIACSYLASVAPLTYELISSLRRVAPLCQCSASVSDTDFRSSGPPPRPFSRPCCPMNSRERIRRRRVRGTGAHPAPIATRRVSAHVTVTVFAGFCFLALRTLVEGDGEGMGCLVGRGLGHDGRE